MGIYSATWTLSSYYVGFVLSAMGTDFLPRLTASSNDHATMNRLVNEQTEMGVLIAVPGVLATLAPRAVGHGGILFGQFVQGADVARWQILGVFLRVVSWPLGYILIAKGKGLLFTLTEVAGGAIGVLLIFLCMKQWNLKGVGVSFALSYLAYTTMMAVVVWRLTDFCWSASALKILGPAVLIMGSVFACTQFLPEVWSAAIGLVATAICGRRFTPCPAETAGRKPMAGPTPQVPT